MEFILTGVALSLLWIAVSLDRLACYVEEIRRIGNSLDEHGFNALDRWQEGVQERSFAEKLRKHVPVRKQK